MSSDVSYNHLAVVEGADTYKEAAIIRDGPPIQVFSQRAAPTVVLRALQQNTGRFYYECQTDTGGFMQLGLADTDFKAIAVEGKGAGDDAHSWAFDGCRCLKWHRNIREHYGRSWKEGDTVGIAVDIDQKVITFYLNGESLGEAFRGFEFAKGLFPCVSLARGERITLKLGLSKKDCFNFAPPDGFVALTITSALKVVKAGKYTDSVSIIQLSMSDSSFIHSFPGQIMVDVMGRGLDYEAKKNGIIHFGYEVTCKRYQGQESLLLTNTQGIGLTKDELMALICYTLEEPPVYQYFNNDTREGFRADGNDFPFMNYLLSQGCKKILKATPESQRSRTVYRGVKIPFAGKVGETFRFGAYTSTSANPKKAEEFQNLGGTMFIMETKLGALIQMLSAFPEEEEVLVPPYEVFRITKVNETAIIYCESATSNEYLQSYLS